MISVHMQDTRFSDKELDVSFHGFSGGERNVKFSSRSVDFLGYAGCNSIITVKALLRSSDDIMDLVLVTDAIKRLTSDDVYMVLDMPYVPYARQDRAMNPGESLAIKCFCNIINSLKFNSVIITDPHSDVTGALLDNVSIIEQHVVASARLRSPDYDVIVAPDAGAVKKATKLAELWHHDEIGIGTKHRNLSTGEITGTGYTGPDVTGKNVLIVDDIADGMATFIFLAKHLRQYNPKSITLFVTHGIFSKGIDIADGVIDRIFSHNIWDDNVKDTNTHGILIR